MPSAASRLMPTLRRVVLAGAAADRTDGQLLSAFVVNRDADAFAGIVRRHGPMVLGVCRRVTGDHAVADDAFQAVFIVLARRAGVVKPREQVGNWLYGVAYRTALKARAVLARRRSREKQVDVMPEPPVSQRTTIDWADLQPVIDEELSRLPAKLRVPVVLCDLEGRAQRDVARHLGIPPATLATRIATARRTLAARLTKRGVTLSGGALAGLLCANGTASAVPHALAQGVMRAAEIVIGGGVPLVSAQAVQLSEGVMRMMLLTKLKAVAVTALTLAALTGGLGLGLLPAYAARMVEDPATAARPVESPMSPMVAMDEFVEVKLKRASLELNADVDDATFLRRLSLDLRGILPTDVESFFFIADEDEDKRAKVVVWMSDDEEVRAHAAKKLGVPAERIHLARLVDVGGGKPRHLVIVVDGDEKSKSQALAFTPDGKSLTVELVTDRKDVRVAPMILDFGTGTNVKRGEVVWALTGEEPKATRVRYLNADNEKDVVQNWLVDGQTTGEGALWIDQGFALNVGDSDVDFLKRAIKDVRGGAPTALEEKYFAEDKDPKKREKLLDALLKDPAVAKKLGDDWKKRMLAVSPSDGKSGKFLLATDPLKKGEYKFQVVPQVDPGKRKVELKMDSKQKREGVYELRLTPTDPKSGQAPKEGVYEWKFLPTIKPESPPATPKSPETPKVRSVKVVPATPATPAAPPKPPAPAAPRAGTLDRAISALIAAGKSDADILDFITLDVLGRLPTDAEKKLTLRLVSKAADRKAAWLDVARALAETSDGKTRSDTTGRFRLESKDVDVNLIELTGTVEGVGGVLQLQVNPAASPDLKPKPDPKPVPPTKK